jgi:hypothetical protein
VESAVARTPGLSADDGKFESFVHNCMDKTVTRTSLIGSGEMQREAVPLGVPSWLVSSFRDVVRFRSFRPLKLLRSAEKS